MPTLRGIFLRGHCDSLERLLNRHAVPHTIAQSVLACCSVSPNRATKARHCIAVNGSGQALASFACATDRDVMTGWR